MLRNALPSIVKLRPDIEWVHYPDQRKWVAKDPISNAFFYFSEFDHAVASRLDGTRTLSEIITLGQRQLGRQLTRRWLNRFVRSLANSRLLQTSSLGSAQPMRVKWGRIGTLALQTLLSPLSVRIPLLRPQQHSWWLQLLARILFHPSVGVGLIVATLCNGWLLLNQLLATPEQLIYEVSRIQGDRWLLILVLYLLVKLCHEFGHWAACAKWQADCREIGILFLCFTPCLYCDITDCWKLDSKWRRAAIAAAGIYVELLLANLAAVVWMNSTSDLSHLLSGSVILTCTLGTVLVNGNPCFKYDGYYILSDLWGVPNLHQQSSTALWQVFIFALGGRPPQSHTLDGNVPGLAIFCCLSAIYRFVILCLLIWIIWMVLEPIGLGLIGLLIIVPILFGKTLAVTQFIRSLVLEFYSRHGLSLYRFGLLLLITVGGMLAIFWAPIPRPIFARGVLSFADKKPLFVSRTAIVEHSELRREMVQPGELLLQLNCAELELEILTIEHEVDLLDTKIKLLQQAAVTDPLADYEIPTSMELLKEYKARLSLLDPEKAALRQVAPERGHIIPSNLKAPSPLAVPEDLRRSMSPIAQGSLGCTVERGATLGWFISNQRATIEALVSEQNIKSLRVGMTVECLLDAEAFTKLPGHITRISIEPVEDVPNELVGDPMLVHMQNKDGRWQTELPHYRVVIELADTLEHPVPGSLAAIRFWAPAETLWSVARKLLFQSR